METFELAAIIGGCFSAGLTIGLIAGNVVGRYAGRPERREVDRERYPSEDEMLRSYNDGHKVGYEAGHREGEQTGYGRGYVAGQKRLIGKIHEVADIKEN